MNKNIFLSGYWVTNLGDDLFVKIVCDRYPNYNFFIETTNKHKLVFSNINNLNTYTISDSIWKKIVIRLFTNVKDTSVYFKKYSKTPIYIELGGSIFMMPNSLKNKRAINKRDAIRKIAKKYYVIGSNFGPYYFDEQITEYKNLFEKLDGIVFRDSQSVDLFPELSNIKLASDIVFNLDVSKFNNDENSNNFIISVIDLKVKPGVKSNDIHNYEKYIKNSIINLVDNNKTVTLMSFCEREGDMRAANRILKKLPEKYQKFVTIYKHFNIDESLTLIAKSEGVIATRFHAMILGWVFRKPVYVLAYSSKTTNVIEDIFKDQNYLLINNISSNQSPITLNDFVKIPEHLLSKAIKSSKKQFQYVDNLN